MKIWNINMVKGTHLLVLFLLLFVAGCNAQTVNSERKDAPLEYEVLEPPYDANITEILNSQKQTGGEHIVKTKNDTYVVISLGQRPSAGYKIQIVSVEKSNEKIVVKFSEKKPEGMAASVITYPSMVIKLPATSLPIEVQQMK